MGIAGLLRALKGLPITTRVPLRGQSVVIDGPALVHRVWEMLLKDRRGSSVILGQVTYSEVSQSVINWLDDLCSQDVQVRKIYFDGYLPPFKWETRKQRLIKQTENIHALPSVYRNGVGIDSRPLTATGRISSMRFSSHAVHHVNSMPKHPFLVPAVVESLRLSHWANVVQIVPGEADAFCAREISQNGGLLLTTDSDLLLQDHGPKGSVVFLWDLYCKEDQEPAETVLHENDWLGGNTLDAAISCSRSQIERYFGMELFGGLPKLIFDWQQGGGSLVQASKRLTSSPESRYDENAYDEFLKEHIPVEYFAEAHPVVNLLSSLDPRISELVLQLLDAKVLEKKASKNSKRTVSAPKFSPRGPEELSIFLPSMIEDTSQRSCWEYSQTTRQLAYGLARGFAQELRHNSIIEYRALRSLNGGRDIPIPTASTVDTWCELLATALDQLTPARDTEVPYSRWMALAFYQEIQRSREEGAQSLAVELTTQALKNELKPKEYSWQYLHFAAIFHASLYSLRILAQVLDVRSSLIPEQLTPSQKRLQEHLRTLPPITEWPTVLELRGDLQTFGNGEGLAAVSRALGIPEIQLRNPTIKKKKRPRTSTNTDSQKPISKMARSKNPFDALEMT